jgi:hypothetical protein
MNRREKERNQTRRGFEFVLRKKIQKGEKGVRSLAIYVLGLSKCRIPINPNSKKNIDLNICLIYLFVGIFVEGLWVDKTPMPKEYPDVPEVGLTSAPMESMAFHFAEYCKYVTYLSKYNNVD